jgi:hypothetical protein
MSEVKPAPTIEDLAELAGHVVRKVMITGSTKSGLNEWWTKNNCDYHGLRAIKHTSICLMQKDGNAPKDVDGENKLDHAERAIVRAVFLLAKLKGQMK